jgi:3-hydroxyacyl-CoA dehydrogenase
MQKESLIRRVGVVGTGLIGASWAALFLARGLDVVATDPAPQAEQKLRKYVTRAWPALQRLGLAKDASLERLDFKDDLNAAVGDVDFVQENGPEREDVKVKLFAELDDIAPAHAILASSSSGLMMSTIQHRCRRPERCVIGHPFNPPHLIPLVELVGGIATSPDTIDRAEKFYTSMGKRTIRLLKEVPGHVANRLQAALWREVVHLVDQGVISVGDADDAVSWGPGLRWGVMGPNLLFHLGGGEGGIEHFMTQLSGPFCRWWDYLGQPVLTPELKGRLIQGVKTEAAGRTIAELEKQRDDMLIKLLALRAHQDSSVRS